MRKSFTAAVAFAAIFAIAIPATAAPSGKKNAPRQQSSVREAGQSPALTAIRKFLKKFGVTTQAWPVGPIPEQDGDN